MFGNDVFPSEASARFALVRAIKATKYTREDIQDAIRYTKAKIVKTELQANIESDKK